MSTDNQNNSQKSPAETFLSRRNIKTPPHQVFTREGGGGKSFTYVKVGPVLNWLDENYPGAWSFEAVDPHIEIAGFVYVNCCLTVYESSTQMTRKITGLGCDELTVSKSSGEIAKVQYLKAAETDALKRCVAKLGGFNDIYQYSEVGEAEEISDSDLQWYQDNVMPKATAKQVFRQIRMITEGRLTINEIKERYK